MPHDHLPSALDRQVRLLQFCPDPAFDVLIGNPVIMAIIGNGSRFEDPSGLLVHQDKIELLPGEAAKRFGIQISRTLFVDALMLMVEVIVIQPSDEGFIDLLDRFEMDVLQDEVSLDEPEQALDFAFCLRFPAVERLDTKLAGIPLIVGLSGAACGLGLGSPVGQDGLR
jgi:hypothetical protein